MVSEWSDSRATTAILGCFAAGSVLFFVAVYALQLSAVKPGTGIRPMSALPLIAAVLGRGGWIPCVVEGVRQLFVGPRQYGMVSLGFGALQVLAYRLAEWQLMGSRGIHWGN